jgi:N-methylhydantoinase A
VRYLDIRYVGQHHEVTVEIPSGVPIGEQHLPVIAEAFHRAHEKLYTYSTPENPLEVMNLRVTAVGHVDKTGLFEHPVKGRDPSGALKGTRKLHFPETCGFVEVPVYSRDRLAPGNRIPGPAVIEERITTVVVHPGWNSRIDSFENVVMEVKG